MPPLGALRVGPGIPKVPGSDCLGPEFLKMLRAIYKKMKKQTTIWKINLAKYK